MDRNFWTFVGAMLVLFMAGAMVRTLESDIDWAGETPAAWLQAIGGLVAVGVAAYFGVAEHRRTLRAERAALKARSEARRGVLLAAVSILEAAVRGTETMIKFSSGRPPESVIAFNDSWVRNQNALSADMERIARATTEPDLLVDLAGVGRRLAQRGSITEGTSGAAAMVRQLWDTHLVLFGEEIELLRKQADRAIRSDET